MLDVLVVALGSGGAGAVLATSVSTWLSQPRRADVKLTVTAEDGRHIGLDARRVRNPVVLHRFRLSQWEIRSIASTISAR